MPGEGNAQMSPTKLSLMFIGLAAIWLLCFRAEVELPDRHQLDLQDRIGEKGLSPEMLTLYSNLNNKKNVKDTETKIGAILDLNYPKVSEQDICIVVRDFEDPDFKDNSFRTLSSIIKQDYKKWHIIYVTVKNDSSIGRAEYVFIRNQISDNQYEFMLSEGDYLKTIILASKKCPNDGIIIPLRSNESLASSKTLQIVNSIFSDGKTSVAWSNSMYNDDKIGFSVPYPQTIVTKKDYRKYIFLANEFTAFRNSELSVVNDKENENNLIYPLWLAESYMLKMLQKAQTSRYIPEVMSFKSQNRVLRSDRSEVEKEVSEAIFQQKSIMPILNRLKNK